MISKQRNLRFLDDRNVFVAFVIDNVDCDLTNVLGPCTSIYWWEGKVEQAMFLGDTIDGHINVSGQRLRVKIHPSRTLQVDSRVYLVISPERWRK